MGTKLYEQSGKTGRLRKLGKLMMMSRTVCITVEEVLAVPKYMKVEKSARHDQVYIDTVAS